MLKVLVLDLNRLRLLALSGKSVQVVCVFLTVMRRVAGVVPEPHLLLQVDHVLDLLRGRLVVALACFPRRLELGVLGRVVAGQVAVLVVAEDLHLTCFRGHTPVR